MIVCHCNVITSADIHSAVDELLSADPLRVITPGLVYMTLGKRGRCCGCFPNAITVINDYVDACRARDELADRRHRGNPEPVERRRSRA
ncbi:(2Fe-2S)-binding protein [Chthonobacter albigriseus]|uniref:(2Fe-2S)-binding protein n=1 Tax=Chthonobacter albigriseus TaxID=1683161 RepID=UPI0015EF60D2|nr:(2Fe-2S)-binding protein [Chthonobacter albigriseus]